MRSRTQVLVACLAGLLAACGGGSGGSASGGLGGAGLSSGSLKTDTALQAVSSAEAAPSLIAEGVDPNTPKQARLDLSGRAPGDARNGVYRIYAANGSQQMLSINFDTMSYTVTDGTGDATSGSFINDVAETGTYVFLNSRVAGSVNNARFRIAQDVVVGGFPFAAPYSNPATYAVQPFLAVRSLVTDAAQLDGTYNRFGISRSSLGVADSQILQLKISQSGRLLEMCFDNAINRIENCPQSSKRSYTITADASGLWRGTNPADTTDQQTFRMARIGDQNVYLTAGTSFSPSNQQALRIGLQDSTAWPASRAIGLSTEKTWGVNNLSSALSRRRSITPDGVFGTLELPITTMGGGPDGIRGLNLSGDHKYYVMQNGLLSVIVGTRNANTQGYIQINLLDTGAEQDARNGRYKVFATNGTRQWLALNMDTGRYEMTDSAGAVSAGTFASDPSESGTYVFTSDRITSAANTARFRLATDTVVGAFPFAVTQAATTSYAVQPFVASRALETDAAALDGVYNRFGIDVASASASSTISQFQISSNGSTLIRCTNNTIYKISNCPSESLQTWTISAGSTANTWTMTEVTNPTNYSIFSVARLGNQKIFLIAGKLATDPLASVFRIGVSDSSAWPTGTGAGASTQGSWGAVNVQATQSTRSAIATDGTTSAALNVFGALDPDGMRVITNGGAGLTYFAMQGAKIFAIVGANSPSTAGYLQINLMD